MKKRTILWGIFLIIGIICSIGNCKGAKAEEWDPSSGEPWIPPSWVDDDDEPVATAIPEDYSIDNNTKNYTTRDMTSSELDYINFRKSFIKSTNDANKYADVLYFAGMYQRLDYNMSTGYLFPNISASSLPPGGIRVDYNPWPYDVTDEYGSEVNSSNNNINISEPFEYPNSTIGVNCISGQSSIFFASEFFPNAFIDNDMDINLSFCWNVKATMIENAQGDLAYSLGVNNASLTDSIEVAVFIRLLDATNSLVVELAPDYVPLLKLGNYVRKIDTLGSLPDNLKIDCFQIVVVVDYNYNNIAFSKVMEYYSQNNTTGLLPRIYYKADSNMQMQIVISSSEDAKNRNFFSKLIHTIFVPDSDEIEDLLLSYIGDPDSGGSATILGLRTRIYNSLVNSNNNATITIPPLSVTLNGNTYQFFDGYTFNLATFYNGELSILVSSTRFITSALMVTLFIKSLFSLVCTVFGLNIWGGVEDDNDISS